MSIKISGNYSDKEYDDIEDFLKSELDGSDYDTGQLETVAYTAENNSKAIGRLMQTLYDNGVLTLKEVHRIATGYTGDRKIEEVE